MKRLITVVLASMTLVACNGGGGGSSSGGDAPTPTPPFVIKPLTVSVATNSPSGLYESGNPVVDASPFAYVPTVTITLTNPYSDIEIQSVSANIADYSPSQPNDDFITYIHGSSTGGTCQQITASNPLKPGVSCNATFRIRATNATESDIISTKTTTNYKIEGYINPITWNYQNIYVKKPQWVSNGQGYTNIWASDSSAVKVMSVVHEGSDDYFYSSAGQKVKVTFDSNGIAQLNSNNVVYCSNTGCTGGLVPTNFLGTIPYSPYNVSSGSIPSGKSNAVDGLNNQSYSRYHGTGNYIFAVQPDGTMFGKNNGVVGCWSSSGSSDWYSNWNPTNFRALQNPTTDSFNYDSDSAQYTASYGSTNWVYGGSGAKYYYKIVADSSGTCTLDTDNVLDALEVDFTTQNQTSSFSGSADNGVEEQAQITPNGVYNLKRMSQGSQLTFYKYPPRE